MGLLAPPPGSAPLAARARHPDPAGARASSCSPSASASSSSSRCRSAASSTAGRRAARRRAHRSPSSACSPSSAAAAPGQGARRGRRLARARRVRALHAGRTGRRRLGALRARFGLDERVEVRRRFNVAPGRRRRGRARPGATARPRATPLRWGLVPALGRVDPKLGSRMINARAETLAEKPAFRDAFARRRCLVVADGFYEWERRARRAASSPGGSRAPTASRSPSPGCGRPGARTPTPRRAAAHLHDRHDGGQRGGRRAARPRCR